MRSQVEAGSSDAAMPLGSSRQARVSLLIALVAALALAAVVLSSVAVADQLPVQRFGGSGAESGRLQNPAGLASDPATGAVYVADTGNNRIDKFSAQGSFELAFGWGVEDGSAELQTCASSCEAGNHGPGAGEMNEVVGVAVSPLDGDVYTVNRRDGRIQRFTSAGAFVEQFGGYGAGPDEFGRPLPPFDDIAIGPDGRVFVVDRGKSRIAVFSTAGAFDSEFSPSSMNALAVGATGRVYVGNEFGVGSIAEYEEESGSWTFKEEASLGESSPPSALAVNPATGNLLALTSTGFEGSFKYELKEVDASGQTVAVTLLPQLTRPRTFAETPSVGLAANAVATFPEHEPGAVYATDPLANEVQILAEGEPQEPRISGLKVSNRSSTFADLAAQLNPEGLATEYFFEYGTTPAYGSTFPAGGPAVLGGGFETQTVGAHLTGLAPSTTYHYKLVARNAKGAVASGDQTFTTFALGGPSVLPDGRAYEMVTPVEKGHNDVEPRGSVDLRGIAGDDEQGMSFITLNGLPGSETGLLELANVAKRGGAGWSSSVASPADLNQTTIGTGVPIMLSNDLKEALVSSKVKLTADAPPGVNMYVHTLSPSSYQLVTAEGYDGFAPTPSNAVGASTDFSRVFFNSSSLLTPDAGTNEFTTKLYEWDGSALHDVGILPGESLPFEESLATYPPELRPVSEDGASVVFGAEPEPGKQLQLFRRAGGQTVEVSAPQPGVVDPHGSRPAQFVGAAADGSSVFFTSMGTLTSDANTGGDSAPNLYRYDVATGTLTDLTVDTADPGGAAVLAALVAGSGEAAYFAAEGVLAPGAQAGQPNLYRWRQGGGIEFIATLLSSDPFVRGFLPEQATNASGNALAFVSSAGLAGQAGAAGISEIYHYSPGEGLACVSCGQGSGGSGATMPASSLLLGGGGTKPLSADGRKVFFSTADGLVTQDTNGKLDAYEWEAGVNSLISSGSGNWGSYFVDASPSGKDVYFATRDQLVKADTDENTDVYDAREGGGFAEPPGEASPCEGEACRPPLAAAPAAPQLGSQSFDGPHNKKPKHHKKHKAKKHGGKAKHHKKNKSKAHSGGKRG